jgi:hypothetical protein
MSKENKPNESKPVQQKPYDAGEMPKTLNHNLPKSSARPIPPPKKK